MKKARLIALATALIVLLSGCRPLVKDEDIPRTYRIYASFYPVYALASLIISDIPDMELHMLTQPQDGCLRSYFLSDWEQYIAANADAVILNGNGFESFESGFLSLGENGPAVISASSALVLKKFAQENENSHFSGANPWLFLSVDGAEELVRAICANMIALDPDYENRYLDNLEKAEIKLKALKRELAGELSGIDRSAPVAIAQEGLAYLADELSLNVVLTIAHESGDMPDDSEIDAMIDAMRQSGAKAILMEKQAPRLLVRALENAGFAVILLDTLSAGNESMGAQGYFEKMKGNAGAIKAALSRQENDEGSYYLH